MADQRAELELRLSLIDIVTGPDLSEVERAKPGQRRIDPGRRAIPVRS